MAPRIITAFVFYNNPPGSDLLDAIKKDLGGESVVIEETKLTVAGRYVNALRMRQARSEHLPVYIQEGPSMLRFFSLLRIGVRVYRKRKNGSYLFYEYGFRKRRITGPLIKRVGTGPLGTGRLTARVTGELR